MIQTECMKLLVDDLKAIRTSRSKSRFIEALINRANENYYDDFYGPLTFPITQLIIDLHNAGLHELEKNAGKGRYDHLKHETIRFD